MHADRAHLDRQEQLFPRIWTSLCKRRRLLTQLFWFSSSVFLGIQIMMGYAVHVFHDSHEFGHSRSMQKASTAAQRFYLGAKLRVHTVVMIPTALLSGRRRKYINDQFLRQNWRTQSVVMIYILGTRDGKRLEKELNVSQEVKDEIEKVEGRIQYFFSACRDEGDQMNNPNGTSATTCKVYEGFKRVYSMYFAEFVWRSADDAYLNLQMWFRVAASMPTGHLYFGRKRVPKRDDWDVQVNSQPDLQEALQGLEIFGPYMLGMGFLVSYSVVEFLAELKIAPRLTWCEDIMVGMWLLPYDVQWRDCRTMGIHMLNRQEAIEALRSGAIPSGDSILLVHYIQPQDWGTIEGDGRITFEYTGFGIRGMDRGWEP